MYLSLKKIKAVFPKFNEVAVTEDDFWRVCKKFRIIVKEIPIPVDGYYQRKRGRDYIVIDKRLKGQKWLHTALHELMHYLLDEPLTTEEATFYRRKDGAEPQPEKLRDALIEKREKIADALAVIGMLPFPELKRLSREDLTDRPETVSLVRDRIAVLAEFRR